MVSLRRSSHWPAKFSVKRRALASASMRSTSAWSTSGLRSSPFAARANSASSGHELHRKYERREATA